MNESTTDTTNSSSHVWHGKSQTHLRLSLILPLQSLLLFLIPQALCPSASHSKGLCVEVPPAEWIVRPQNQIVGHRLQNLSTLESLR